MSSSEYLLIYFPYRTYLPNKVSYVLSLWKTELGKINEKAGQSLADPEQYENLFPGFQDALKTQQFLALREPDLLPALYATKVPMNIDRNAMEEMEKDESQGSFQYSKLDKPEELTEKVQQLTLSEAPVTSSDPPNARKNSLDEFDLDDLDENIDTSDVNLDDEELLSD